MSSSTAEDPESLSSDDVQPLEEDCALVAKTTACAKLWWRPYGPIASRPHRAMLESCDVPTSLVRLAYFARGNRNAADGRDPLSDGEEVLGESYANAALRLVNLGLLRQSKPELAVAVLFTAPQLKAWLRSRGYSAKSTKAAMADKIAEVAGHSALEALIASRLVLERTEAGLDVIRREKDITSGVLSRIRASLRRSIKSGDLEAVVTALVDLAGFTGSSLPTTTFVANLRRWLMQPLPPDIDLMGVPRTDLLTAAIASEIYSYDLWSAWGIVKDPVWRRPPKIDIPQEKLSVEELNFLRSEAEDIGMQFEDWFKPRETILHCPADLRDLLMR